KGDLEKLQRTFSATLTIHIAIALIVVIIAETVGLWYITKVMVYPPERRGAVMVIYQISIVAAALGIMQVPYNALIIARERMDIFAYISVLEVAMKLGAVIALAWYPADKLIAYALMILAIASIIRVLYQIYCRRHFPESKFRPFYNREYYRELVSYSVWSLFGNVAGLAKMQGVNMVLNSFFGTIINASYGVTAQVAGAVQSFVNNFQVALNPQIIKSYSQNRFKESETLIFQGAKFSYLLLLVIAVPVLLESRYILELWLKEVPPHTVTFVRLSLINLLIDSLAGPIITAIQATGKIKRYQLLVGSLITLNVPISFIALKFTNSPHIVFVVSIAISLIAMQLRLYSLERVSPFSPLKFYRSVAIPLATATAPLLAVWLLWHPTPAHTLYQFLLHSVLCIVAVVATSYFIAINSRERALINGRVKKIIKL
ncbi:MAG: lipopolysaccharide biosynthesis protein, partial [Bacteroidales bacterium]